MHWNLYLSEAFKGKDEEGCKQVEETKVFPLIMPKGENMNFWRIWAQNLNNSLQQSLSKYITSHLISSLRAILEEAYKRIQQLESSEVGEITPNLALKIREEQKYLMFE